MLDDVRKEIEIVEVDLYEITKEYKTGDDASIRNAIRDAISNDIKKGNKVTLIHRPIREGLKEKGFDMYVNNVADRIRYTLMLGGDVV